MLKQPVMRDFLQILSYFLYIVQITSQFTGCDYFQALESGESYTIQSPGYPKKYKRNTNCRWLVESPPKTTIALVCGDVQLSSSRACKNDALVLSTAGRTDMADGQRYCGSGEFTSKSVSNRMTLALRTGATGSGSFKCTMRSSVSTCDCGRQNRGRIVGGKETVINQYPPMAGVVDADEKRIFCGATIISNTHAISAAHCSLGRKITRMAIVVGEHNVTTGTETAYTALHLIASFLRHPKYNSSSNANDISIITTVTTIRFNFGVGPACLPFKFRSTTFVGNTVVALGWGAKEFSGPSSSVLLNVFLNVVKSNYCLTDQLCTLSRGFDTCQNDSGGPLFYVENNELFVVAIVSFGFACATDKPSVNTRVTSYIDWIVKNTKSKAYCAR